MEEERKKEGKGRGVGGAEAGDASPPQPWVALPLSAATAARPHRRGELGLWRVGGPWLCVPSQSLKGGG